MTRFATAHVAATLGEALSVPFDITASSADLPTDTSMFGPPVELLAPREDVAWISATSLRCQVRAADFPDLGVAEQPFHEVPVEIGDPFLAASAERANVELTFWLRAGELEVRPEQLALWRTALSALERL
jgi:hypothetical protein